MTSERQLGLLWGGVAMLLVAMSPLAARMASTLPSCPVKRIVGIPCPTCGTTRVGVALSRLDLADAISINPLAVVAWVVLVGGGFVAGSMALWNVPLREPEWNLSAAVRWFLVLVFLTNWVYLVGAGT